MTDVNVAPPFVPCTYCTAHPDLRHTCLSCKHNRETIAALQAQIADSIPSTQLYDLCARAFGISRDTAKKRLTGAMFGKQSGPLNEPTLIGWTWGAHLDELHEDVRENRWLKAAESLSRMLEHAIQRVKTEVEFARKKADS